MAGDGLATKKKVQLLRESDMVKGAGRKEGSGKRKGGGRCPSLARLTQGGIRSESFGKEGKKNITNEIKGICSRKCARGRCVHSSKEKKGGLC